MPKKLLDENCLPSGLVGRRAHETVKYFLSKIYISGTRNDVDLDELCLIVRQVNDKMCNEAIAEPNRFIERPIHQLIPPNNSVYNEAYIRPFKRIDKLSNKPLAPIVPDEGE